MTKKITISIPDELHEKMDQWREAFNFSKIFQDTISEAIKKKENFKKRLKEVTTMEQVIERLKKERNEADKSYSEKGKEDGLEWAKVASYEELLYAIKWEPMNEQPGLIGYDPTRDEVLGDYFGDIMEDNESMGFVEKTYGNFLPNSFFAAWEEGWVEGIKEFWGEIKDKL